MRRKLPAGGIEEGKGPANVMAPDDEIRYQADMFHCSLIECLYFVY
jgi:hypothetical protein